VVYVVHFSLGQVKAKLTLSASMSLLHNIIFRGYLHAGLIPELFPEQRTTAMAAYNSAIYMGRALSFGAVILAGQLGIPTGDIGIRMVNILCSV
jgi:hypothetical protein